MNLPQVIVQPASRPCSSFHQALRILPGPRRAAMFDIYALCRAVDDIADGAAPPAEKRAALESWRQDLHACADGSGPAHLANLQRDIVTFSLVRADFDAVIDSILLAHHLGRALQLTNILRDIDEDADIGRAYLPRACIRLAGRAHARFDEAAAVMRRRAARSGSADSNGSASCCGMPCFRPNSL